MVVILFIREAIQGSSDLQTGSDRCRDGLTDIESLFHFLFLSAHLVIEDHLGMVLFYVDEGAGLVRDRAHCCLLLLFLWG